jgi:Putative cyclase
VGRGVLVDYQTWREANNVEYDCFSDQAIPLAHLKATLESQGTQLQFGDILMIRSGYTETFNKTSTAEILERTNTTPPKLAGVEQSEEVLEWIWDNFSAVAGDHPSFERWRE